VAFSEIIGYVIATAAYSIDGDRNYNVMH